MTMLVFGFRRPLDFLDAAMALRRGGPRPGPSKDWSRPDCRNFINATGWVSGAINVVFTRIVNDYSTVHGTTVICPIRGRSHEPVNLGS